MTSTAFGGTKTATVNGTTLAYREQGDGEPVVFVHGGISDLRIWDQQLSAIGKSYRAIAYSRRFARPNEPIDPEASDPILTHIHDLAAFLNEVGASPAHLVGNSWGALICLLTALRYPEVVRSMVLEEAPAATLLVPSIPPSPVDLVRLIVRQPRTAIAMLKFVLSTVARSEKAFRRGEEDEGVRFFARGVLGKKPLEELPEPIREQFYENRDGLRALLLHPDPEPPRIDADDLRRTRCPVLLVTGELSPDFLLRLTDRLEELLPIVERVEIPDASHIMHAENAPAVNEAIVGFLGQHRLG
jgi:pimeloyl-ACP methyl ester carboxylesterase